MSRPRVSRGRLMLGLLLLSLLLAGVVSRIASRAPDGLNSTADKLGFADTARPHRLDGSPFAGYHGPWAGVVGVLVVLALAGGVTWLLRRRGARDDARGGS